MMARQQVLKFQAGSRHLAQLLAARASEQGERQPPHPRALAIWDWAVRAAASGLTLQSFLTVDKWLSSRPEHDADRSSRE
jgi:hypothetical protein